MAEHQNSLSNLWFSAAGTVVLFCGIADHLRPQLRSSSSAPHRIDVATT